MKNRKVHEDQHECGCVYCRDDKEFELPEPLLKACINGDLVIFAGAGISTESDLVYPTTFYEDIAHELNISFKEKISFSDLMSRYVKKAGRRKLLQKIKKRLDYVDSFGDLRRASTRFHKELATIPQIREIVTTNWDTFFESESGATPIVIAEDYAFWDLPGRKVFKIHGSINNIGTLVVTKEDYIKCYKALSKGIIGASLKHMLATKTVVFIGYSFKDEDFQKIYNYLQKEMEDILPHSYVVAPSEDKKNTAKNSTVIQTDGRYFIEKLKEELIKKEVMLPDHRFNELNDLYVKVKDAHLNIIDFNSFSKFPELVYAASYQDGLIHLLERVQARWNTGEYSDEHHLSHIIHSYMRLLKGAIRGKRYFDAAYIDGYLNGLFSLVLDEPIDEVPVFYLYGYKGNINNFKELKLKLNKGNTTKSALKKAESMMKRVGDLQPSHTPFLDGVEAI